MNNYTDLFNRDLIYSLKLLKMQEIPKTLNSSLLAALRDRGSSIC